MIVRVFATICFLLMSSTTFASYSAPGALFSFNGYLCLNANGNFRAGPSQQSASLRVIGQNQRHYADAMTGDGNWFRFVINGQTGFIHRSILRYENCA